MLRKEIKFEDLNGNSNSVIAYFHMGTSEVLDLEARYEGGWVNAVNAAMEKQDGRTVYSMFVDLVERSYGVKSDDGLRFKKSPEITAAFKESPAWDEFFMSLLSDEKEAAAFFNNILPKNFHEKAKQFREGNAKALENSETRKILGMDD